MSKNFNVLTSGLPQILAGLALLALCGIIFLTSGIVWFWPGAVGFVLLLWGLLGGQKDDGGF